MATTAKPCPECGATATRPLSRKELRERNNGQDPLVVTMPRICTGCGHVWEPPLSKSMCYLVAAIAAVGSLIGVALLAFALTLLIYTVFAPAVEANNARNRGALAGLGLTGLALAGGAAAMFRKYWRQARGQT